MAIRLDAAGVLRWTPWERIPWLVHGFSTRLAGDLAHPAPPGAERLFDESGAQLVTLEQVHSNVVRDAREALDAHPARLRGDALVVCGPGVLAAVRTADCLPLLLLDEAGGAAAAVHAGWRGAAQGIAALTVERMTRDFGSDPARLEALLGPSISVERFEVGPEVAERFPPEAVVRKPGWPKLHVDLALAVRMQLEAAGVPRGHIQPLPLCTFDRKEWFHSHRRDAAAAGRMLAAIGIRG